MNDQQSKEQQLDRIRKCLKNNWLIGLDKYCEDVFDPSQLDKSKGKQTLNWLRYNEPELDNKIEALKAINGVGFEDLEEDKEDPKNLTISEILKKKTNPFPTPEHSPLQSLPKPKSQQSKTEQVNDQVTVFLNHPDMSFIALTEDEIVFNGISIEVADFSTRQIPSFDLVIRDANTELSTIFNLGQTYEEAMEIFEAEIKDMLFETFLLFSQC
jgi:hypothetical protein